MTTDIETSFIKLATSRKVVINAIKVSLVVGTLLALINHGDNLMAMSVSSESLIKIALTYLVPYGVATWSAVKAMRG